MYYLFQPPIHVSWTGDYIPMDLRPQLEGNPKADLSVFHWKRAESEFTQIHIAIALRRGHLNQGGILVDAAEFSDIRQIVDLSATWKKLQEGRPAVESFEQNVMEPLMPGYVEHGRQLNSEIDATTERTLDEARERLRIVLKEDPKEQLALYWKRGGGYVPESIKDTP